MIRYIDEPGVISPSGFISSVTITSDVAITTFSAHLFDELLKRTGAKKCGVIKGCADIEVYMFVENGKNIIVYKSPVGAPAAVGAAEEVMAHGIKHIVVYGICGALVQTPPHTIVVPTRAYRDEGTSYHYMPPADYIDLENSDVVIRSLGEDGVATISGGVWTTDGFYRETRTRADEMTAKGCVSVDMECSALQTAALFRGKKFYTFFITADSLAGEQWEPNDILDPQATDSTSVAACAAVSLAKKLVRN